MSGKMDITHEYLVSILDYNPETGIFVWRERPVEHFKRPQDSRMWNFRYSGKTAGWKTDTGYIIITINYVYYRAHVLAWLYETGVYPKTKIDHINLIKTDNRICNLRLANDSQNSCNSGKRPNNTSGYKGVTYHKIGKKWQAQIELNNNYIYLGLFSTAQEAHQAYCEAAIKHHGEFARVE